MDLEQKLLKYAEHNLNVLLIGTHGIGKSSIIKQVATKLGVKLKYYSCSTLDPYTDLTGVPVPNQEKRLLEFFRPQDIQDAELVFFDELNRPSHPRILNAILELVQFKSINGEPLPNLKMVWAAINPPGDDYQVDDLDPALLDRFNVYLKMKADINVEYLKTKMSEDVAFMLRRWWTTDLDENQRRILTPRRIEYIGMMIESGIDWHDALPQGYTFPDGSLDKMIKILRKEDPDMVLTKESILENIPHVIKKMDEDRSMYIKLAEIMTNFSEKNLFECRDIIEKLPKELVQKVGHKKFLIGQRKLFEIFQENNVDIMKYPKMTEVWKLDR